MSVLACDRKKCTHIMCNRLILNGTMYICQDCWEELLDYKRTWPDKMSKADVRKRIEIFMATPSGPTITLTDDKIDEEFKRLTEQDIDAEY